VIYVFDVISTEPKDLWEDVDRFLDASKVLTSNSKQLFIANKMDLNPYTKPEEYYRQDLISKENLITVSAKNKMNIEYVKDQLYGLVISEREISDQTIVTNNRHYDALFKSQESLDKVMHGLKSGLTGDFIAMD